MTNVFASISSSESSLQGRPAEVVDIVVPIIIECSKTQLKKNSAKKGTYIFNVCSLFISVSDSIFVSFLFSSFLSYRLIHRSIVWFSFSLPKWSVLFFITQFIILFIFCVRFDFHPPTIPKTPLRQVFLSVVKPQASLVVEGLKNGGIKLILSLAGAYRKI